MRFIKSISSRVLCSLLILLPVHSYAASGDVDPSFNASAFGSAAGAVYVIRKQPDGKLLIGGIIQDVNGHTASGLARLNVDGSVDTTFVPPDFYTNFALGLTIRAMAVQPDGKILVGGDYTGVNGEARPGLQRLNANGSIDSTWPVPPFGPNNDSLHDVEVASDGKIIVASQNSFFRLNPDGTSDSSFVITTHSFGRVFEIEIQPDGKLLLGGESLIRRNADGSLDETFAPVNVANINSMTLLADGRFLITGGFATVNSFVQRGIARINPNGSIDLTFNQNLTGPDGNVSDAAVGPDGKIYIGGTFTTYNSTPRQRLARLNADGSLDLTFQNNSTPPNSFFPLDLEPSGADKVIVGVSNVFAPASPLFRLNADGSRDTSISWTVTSSGRVRKVVVQPDGKILIGGNFRSVNGVKRQGLARLNADGSLDTSFVPYFNDLAASPDIIAIALQTDGRIMIGTINGLVLRRLFTNGAEDTSFFPNLHTSGIVYDIAPLADGNVIAVGLMLQNGVGGTTRRVAKYGPTGGLILAWAPTQPNQPPYRLLLQPDGKVVIAGEFTQIGTTLRGRIARLDVNGVNDPAFDPPGGANSSIYNIALQTDGKIVLGGAFYGLNGSSAQQYVGRLNADGTLDNSFTQIANSPVVGLYVQPDGKILIGGRFSVVGGVNRRGIARLNSNGAFDNTFTATANTDVLDFAMQTDSKIVAAGEFTKINEISRVRVARLLNSPTAPRTAFDFDGDGRADISVTRPGALYTWYQLRGPTYTYVEFNFGQSGDIVAPADFDGDGKTDAAIFRPSNGQWWYLSSVDGTQRSDTFGASGDIPLPSDYTGDGKADFVLYRPSTGVWQRLANGTPSSANIAFGAPGDKPLVADFDGDGKSDPSIFRPSTGEFWYAASSQGNAFKVFQWGTGTDIPTPADYDGDGKTDFAIYRPSTGVWWIFKSGTSTVMNLTWGVAEDKPIPADYDGDGKADTGLFRPSSGTWYLLNSTSGFAGFQWGISTDIPSPGAFVP